MPRRDPQTGKQPSGAQNRKRGHEKNERAVATQGGELQLDRAVTADEYATGGWRRDDGAWAKAFEACGLPDLENPGTDLAYVRKLQMTCLHQMATTPFPTLAQQEHWRRVNEHSKSVGMTSNRALLEAKVKQLEAALKARQAAAGAVRIVPASSVKKPPTARGMAPPGPRAIPPDALPEDEPPKE